MSLNDLMDKDEFNRRKKDMEKIKSQTRKFMKKKKVKNYQELIDTIYYQER